MTETFGTLRPELNPDCSSAPVPVQVSGHPSEPFPPKAPEQTQWSGNKTIISGSWWEKQFNDKLEALQKERWEEPHPGLVGSEGPVLDSYHGDGPEDRILMKMGRPEQNQFNVLNIWLVFSNLLLFSSCRFYIKKMNCRRGLCGGGAYMGGAYQPLWNSCC